MVSHPFRDETAERMGHGAFIVHSELLGHSQVHSSQEDAFNRASGGARAAPPPPLGGGAGCAAALLLCFRFPRNGAHRVREDWKKRFAETPDVLKSARRQQTVIPVLDMEIGGDEFTTMAGPCSVETEFQLMATANHVRRAGARILRGGAFKPRSSPYAFQGHGLNGLKMLARAREESGLAIVTEVMSEEDVPMVAEYADILQIGTRNMENYALLEAAARSGRPILLKRGMSATIAELLRSAQLILENGNPNVILCERGIRTFETATRNTFDVAAIALLKQISHLPVIADPSHAAGRSDLVPALARIGVAAGADGLLVEVHPNPDKAWSDGDQSLDFAEFDEMMADLDPWLALRGVVRRDRGFLRREGAHARLLKAVG